VVEVATPEAERDAVRRALHELIHEQGLAPAQVVMLGAHKLENSSFADARKLGNYTVRDAIEPEAPNTIRYSTVHKFKGLEADAVLLVGIGEPSRVYDAESWRRFVYVGASRARVLLRVFVRAS
jgi:superfamily I DNA/RNA helicase